MRSPVNWIGGKSASAARIIARMPEHTCYCEPFAGGAWVFFKKPPSRVEVLNDVNEELLTFYRTVKASPVRLIRKLESMPHSRRLWSRLKSARPCESHYLARAARFAYLVKTAYGGKWKGGNFGYSRTRPSPGRPAAWRTLLRSAAARLADTTLECSHWSDVLRRYDSPATLFYCDPPYWQMPYYEVNFEEPDHRDLANALKAIQGRFLLSYNDVPQIRALYAWARVESMDIAYFLDGRGTGTELLISST